MISNTAGNFYFQIIGNPKSHELLSLYYMLKHAERKSDWNPLILTVPMLDYEKKIAQDAELLPRADKVGQT